MFVPPPPPPPPDNNGHLVVTDFNDGLPLPLGDHGITSLLFMKKKQIKKLSIAPFLADSFTLMQIDAICFFFSSCTSFKINFLLLFFICKNSCSSHVGLFVIFFVIALSGEGAWMRRSCCGSVDKTTDSSL